MRYVIIDDVKLPALFWVGKRITTRSVWRFYAFLLRIMRSNEGVIDKGLSK